MTGAADTLPGLLLHQARTRGAAAAYRRKAFGIWETSTWSDVLERVRAIAVGLAALEFRRGDRVAIVGDNRLEWVLAELAVQAAGGIVIGIYQDSTAEEARFLLDFSGARFVVAEDQEQVDKILEIRGRLPGLDKLVYYDPRGMRGYDDPILMELSTLEALGRDHERSRPGTFDRLVEQVSPDDVALLATTSGTTGKPKLARLTHANLLAAARGLHQADPMAPGDDLVSFLPLAWIGEQMLAVASGLAVGLIVNFPEEPETVRYDLKEIGPQAVFSPPRIWENMVSEVQVRIEDASAVRRLVTHWAFAVGEAVEERRRQGHELSAWLRWRRFWAEWLCFFWIKDKLGLRRLKRAYTGGAALGPDVFRFFRAMGVHFKQIYGQTEVSGISVAHRDDDVKFQTVGHPLPHVEIRIAESGEILVRSPAVFQGYYENPEATAEALDDGWLRSGDAGYFDDDGHLVVIDRLRDVVTLSDGSVFSPQFLESKLKFSPYVREAVVFGGGEYPYVSAILVIDFANAGKWAERHRIAYTTFTDLAQKEELARRLAEHVGRVNRDLPEAAQVRRFLLLHKDLDADDEELTRTRKIRRGVIAERYAELVAALYGDGDTVSVATEISYQDGRTSSIETRLRIETPEAAPAVGLE